MHNEVQALWQALAIGPHAGNVRLILDFIISLCLERREQNFVEYAKQIVVYLSATPAGSRVLEFLLMQLVPKNMINEKKTPSLAVPDTTGLPATPVPMEPVVERRLRTVILGSSLHLILVEAVRRQYMMAMQAADRADKQAIRAAQATPPSRTS